MVSLEIIEHLYSPSSKLFLKFASDCDPSESLLIFGLPGGGVGGGALLGNRISPLGDGIAGIDFESAAFG
jgi:hypothetical protein